MISLFSPFRFKDRNVGYAVLNTLVTMEKTQPKAFWSAVGAISDQFETLNGKIGDGTVLGKPHSHESTERDPDEVNLPKATDIDQFMAMRFRNRELGQQIVITLIEIESRDENLFKKLSDSITRISKEAQSS